MQEDDLPKLLKEIVLKESEGGATDHKAYGTMINSVLTKLINKHLTPDADVQTARVVLQVVKAASAIDVSLLCAVLARVAALLPERRMFNDPGFMSDLVETSSSVLSLLQVRDPVSFGSFVRGAALLASDTLEILKAGFASREGAWNEPEVSPSTLCFAPPVPGAQVACFTEFAPRARCPELVLDVPQVGCASQALGFCVGLLATLVDRLPHAVWRESPPLWRTARRSLSYPLCFRGDWHRNAALRLIRAMLEHFPPSSEHLDKLSVTILDTCRFVAVRPDSSGVDAHLLGACCGKLYSMLPTISVAVNSEQLVSAIEATTISLSPSPVLRDSLLDSLAVTAQKSWLVVSPRLPSLLALLFPSNVQRKVLACVREVVAQFSLARGGSSSAPAAADQDDPPSKKRRRTSTDDADTIPIDDAGAGAVAAAAPAMVPAPQPTSLADKPVVEAERKLALDPVSLIVERAMSVRAPPKTIEALNEAILLLDGLADIFVFPPSLPPPPPPETSEASRAAAYASFIEQLPLTQRSREAISQLLSSCMAGISAQPAEVIRQRPELFISMLSTLCRVCRSVVAELAPSVWRAVAEDVSIFLSSLWAPRGLHELLCECRPQVDGEAGSSFREILRDAAESLAFFPAGVCPKRRIEGFTAAIQSPDTAVVRAALRSLPLMISATPESRVLLDEALSAVGSRPQLLSFGPRYLGFASCSAANRVQFKSEEHSLSPPRSYLQLRTVHFPARQGFPWWVSFGPGYPGDSFVVSSCATCEAPSPPSAHQQTEEDAAQRAASEREFISGEVVTKLAEMSVAKTKADGLAVASFFEGLQRLLAHTQADTAKRMEIAMSFVPHLHAMTVEGEPDPRGSKMSIARFLAAFGEYLWRNSQHQQQHQRALCSRLRAELQQPDIEAQEAILAVCGELACNSDGELLTQMLCAILLTLLDSSSASQRDSSLRCLALDQLKKISRSRRVPLPELIRGDRVAIVRELLPRLATMPEAVDELLSSILHAESLVHDALPAILPTLVLECATSKERRAVLESISQRESKPTPLLVLEHMPQILARAFISIDTAKPAEQLCAAPELRFLEELMREKIRSLVGMHISDLLGDLSLMLDDDVLAARAPSIFSAIVSVAADPKDLAAATEKLLREKVTSYFSRQFFPIMDRLFKKFREGPTQREKALRCLDRLLPYFGQEFGRAKVIAFLKLATVQVPLQPLACRVWRTFLDVSVGDLGKLTASELSSIVSYLLVALPTAAAEVVPVLEHLLVEHSDELRPHFRDLPFIPETDATRRIREAIKDSTPTEWRAAVTLALQNLGPGSIDSVKTSSLTQLRKLLGPGPNKRELTAAVLGEEEEFVSSIIRSLLVCLREQAAEPVQLLCLECLGELGAVDPGRVNVVLRPAAVAEELQPQSLGLQLIKDHLVKALRRNTEHQDYAAVSIQDILAAIQCRITPETTKRAASKANAILRELPDDVQETIRPYLSSNYRLGAVAAPTQHPVYRPPMAFRAWVDLWVASLIGLAEAARAPCSPIFTACSAVVKDDLPTALFLLPLIVHSVMKYGDDAARRKVVEEMAAVLQHQNQHHQQPEAESARSTESGEQQQCAQTVFNLIDWLNKWTESQRAAAAAAATGARHGRAKDPERSVVDCSKALSAIPQLTVALAAHRCRSYARALLHFENHARAETAKKQPAADLIREHMAFLLSVFSSLDDVDSAVGISKLRGTVTAAQAISDLESGGKFHEAMTCYDQELCSRPDDAALRIGRLHCMREAGHLDMMLSLVRGELGQQQQQQQQPERPPAATLRSPSPRPLDRAASFPPPAPPPPSSSSSAPSLVLSSPRYRSQLVTCGIEAAWRLGDWRSLESFLAQVPGKAGTDGWEACIGRALLGLQHANGAAFDDALLEARRGIAPTLAAAGFESYQRCYPDVVKLHILRELEHSKQISSGAQAAVLAEWEGRLDITQESFKAREPILTARRMLYHIYAMEDKGRPWLQIAKIARKIGNFQAAYNALQHASAFGVAGEFVEEAKLKWAQGAQLDAIAILRDHVKDVPTLTHDSSSQSLSPFVVAEIDEAEEPRDMTPCRATLLLARWCEQTGATHREILMHYHGAKRMNRKWEKSFFFMARYYDSFVLAEQGQGQQQQQQQQEEGKATVWIPGSAASASSLWVLSAVKNYSSAMICGHRYLHHALPRMLTLWFNFGSVAATKSLCTTDAMDRFRKVNGVVNKTADKLPPYVWLAGLSQLKSRICHPNKDLYGVLCRILEKVVRCHPQQALWQMVGLSKSSVTARRNASAPVFTSACKVEEVRKLSAELSKLAGNLIELCNYVPPETQPHGFQMRSSGLRPLRELSATSNMSLVLPLLSAFSPAFPTSGRTEDRHNPFPHALPTITGVRDDVEVLGTLVKPKKLQILGSGGVSCTFLAKPKDDMRRDARMIEILTLINRILRHHPDASRRYLAVRCYSVIPLNEECGLIEWVPNTNGFRPIIHQLLGPQLPPSTVTKELKERHRTEDHQKLFCELEKLYPKVFHQWFLHQWPEPSAWFEARQAFTRTSAVNSMIGFAVGLGDRHGENILLDSKTGECVHVDWNCLFWKGETFEVPEKVPYRLTRNMIDAMGIAGYDGTFRRVAEITLALLRTNGDALMGVLEGFLYDPLMDWNSGGEKKSKQQQQQQQQQQQPATTSETIHPTAVMTMKRIDNLLKGKHERSVPLSVESQVHNSIEMATSNKNLSDMYVGWAAWI